MREQDEREEEGARRDAENMAEGEGTGMHTTAADSAPTPLWLLNRQQAAAIADESRKRRAALAAEEAVRRDELLKKAGGAAAASREDMLAQYPCIPLSDYAPDGHHLAINIGFPGLRAIHKEPWIFLVPDLLTRSECERLMVKAEPHFQDSERYSNGHRTSYECRIARTETHGIQSRYSKLVSAMIELRPSGPVPA